MSTVALATVATRPAPLLRGYRFGLMKSRSVRGGSGIPMTVWVIRGGRHGEDEAWCLANGTAGAAWNEVPSLQGATSREDVRALVEGMYPGESTGRVANWMGQLWAVRNGIKQEDLVVMPMKTTKARLSCHRPHALVRHAREPAPMGSESGLS